MAECEGEEKRHGCPLVMHLRGGGNRLIKGGDLGRCEARYTNGCCYLCIRGEERHSLCVSACKKEEGH